MTRSEFDRKYTSQLNPQQLAAVHAVDGAVLLLAVPGSGKTHPNFRIPENRPDVNAPFTAGIV